MQNDYIDLHALNCCGLGTHLSLPVIVYFMKLLDLWNAFQQEKSLVLSPTTIQHDFQQVGQWLRRCPHHSVQEARLAMV